MHRYLRARFADLSIIRRGARCRYAFDGAPLTRARCFIRSMLFRRYATAATRCQMLPYAAMLMLLLPAVSAADDAFDAAMPLPRHAMQSYAADVYAAMFSITPPYADVFRRLSRH